MGKNKATLFAIFSNVVVQFTLKLPYITTVLFSVPNALDMYRKMLVLQFVATTVENHLANSVVNKMWRTLR